MPSTLLSSSAARAARASGTVAELLEVLWGRGQEDAPQGSIPPSQLRALTVIEECEGANLRALSQALGSRPSAVSRLCDRLEAAGLLERTPSATSGREIELRLTSHGQTALADIRAARHNELTAVLQTMPAAKLAVLAEGLEAFHSAARHRIGIERPADTRAPSADTA
ncbi:MULTISPECIES: MarR family winged helix-turn-helix transcriptional regulator [Streptomyces]|uniref:MarR family winged helix-turn-helix transcriptional regulator n=1 Tax=Streptomyces TaxID=1883 RepID=UPI0022B049C2|nr:MarR family transcriptional regulator [Streptomyces sp. H39-C1]MCZ4103479.1 MarR family transcriptional regulator [Streptomyces sp. H39-C1]